MLAMGIDIGGTNLRIAMINEGLEVTYTEAVALPVTNAPTELMHFVVNVAKACSRNASIMGVGVGITGVIQPNRMLATSNIAALNGSDPSALFHEQFVVPMLFDNDVRCALRAEVHLGAARSCTDVACISLGTGVGGAVLLDGCLRRGLRNSAGEIGLGGVYNGAVGVMTIERVWQEARSRMEANLVRPPGIAASPRLGAFYPDVEVIGHLGGAVLSLHRILDLQQIIFAGIATKFGQRLLDDVAHVIRPAHVQPPFDCALVLAELGIYSGAVGAACLVMESLGILRHL